MEVAEEVEEVEEEVAWILDTEPPGEGEVDTVSPGTLHSWSGV